MKQLSRLAAPTLSLVLLASCAAIPEEQKTNKKEEDVPKTITVSKEYSIRMTHQAEGQDIPCQMPVYTFTEPQMGETYLLFLKEGQKTYSLSSEPGEVRKDGKEACLSSHFFSEDPGTLPTLPTLSTQAETDSTVYHIAVQSGDEQKKDFLSGMDWEEVVEEVQSLA